MSERILIPTVHWKPPLPLTGRLGPRMALADSCEARSISDLMKQYLLQASSCTNLFQKKIPPFWLRARDIPFKHDSVPYLRDLPWYQQQLFLRETVYPRLSGSSFIPRLKYQLKKGRLNTVEQWFNTAEGCVLPLLVCPATWADVDIKLIDRVTKWSLENCACGYRAFIADLKSFKKAIRKQFAVSENPFSFLKELKHPNIRGFVPYLDLVKKLTSGVYDVGRLAQIVLTVTQTRACGLANHAMQQASLEKFRTVVTTPYEYVPLRLDVVADTWFSRVGRFSSDLSKISAGPSGVRGYPRNSGGQSLALAEICTKTIDYTYSLVTLERSSCPPRRISTARDIVDYCIDKALLEQERVLSVTVTTVNEPSKARCITVASIEYVELLNVCSHIFKDICCTQPVRSGMRANRHLWNFLSKDLHPMNSLWDRMGHPINCQRDVWALSSDLETATDYGNPTVSKQIWDVLISAVRQFPDAPVGLLELSRDLYNSPRNVYYEGNLFCVKQRGWLMGDPMTKVLLTLTQEYVLRLFQQQTPAVGSIVGDDLVILSLCKEALQGYPALLEGAGFKVSYEDTFISKRIMFFCEEGSLVPQHPKASALAMAKLTRGEFCGYIDYPRFRLLIPTRPDECRWSYTTLGRFSLLGKELMWSLGTNKRLSPLMERAVLLQNIIVPQDSDTLCLFTPLEMGGNGSYTADPDFLKQVVRSRSKDPESCWYRMCQLLAREYTYKYIRSERSRVSHRFHVMAKVVENRDHFPPESIIELVDEEHREVMRSFKSFLDPETAFMRLEQAKYYTGLFNGSGKIPDSMDYEFDRSLPTALGGWKEEPDYRRFVRTWRNPGFYYRNDFSFLVRPELLGVGHPLTVRVGLREIPEQPYVPDDLLGRTIDDAYKRLSTADLWFDETLLSRLPMIIESDNLVRGMLKARLRSGERVEVLTLVSTDRKLLISLVHTCITIQGYAPELAVLVDPWIYLGGAGGLDFFEPFLIGDTRLVDPGSIYYADLHFPRGERWWEGELCHTPDVRQPVPGCAFYSIYVIPRQSGVRGTRNPASADDLLRLFLQRLL